MAASDAPAGAAIQGFSRDSDRSRHADDPALCAARVPDQRTVRIADTFLAWKEVDKYSRIVGTGEIAKNDYNISPSRYIHTSDAETYRPIAEIVEELKIIEAEARETDKALKEILEKLGV